MGSKSVLVVATDGLDTATLESALDETAASITQLSSLTDLFDTLTYSAFHALVLPETADGQSGTDIAYGVKKLFPDLPVIVAGADPAAVPDNLDVRAVESSTHLEDAVAEAVRDSLDAEPPTVAGRLPSPMETLLLSLFNELPDHLYAKDEQARHVLMGRGFNEPTDRLGLTDVEVPELDDEHAKAALRDEMDVIEEEIDQIEVEEFLDLDASYVRTRKMPWYDSTGDVQGIVGHTQNITERKLREHAFRRQNERMVKVALVASHELRNELQIAYGQLEGLADCDGPTDEIEESLSQISTIIDTVVELSTSDPNGQIQHDEIEQVPKRKHMWLSRLSREVWDTLADSEARLTFDGDTRIVADQESAGLLLQILFQNALEHAGPSVTVTVGTTADGFFVADDGPGIDVDPPERVFDAGHTAVAENTGFGLYVARRVAADHGWTISMSESESGGARFDIGNVDCQA
ncbi:PAS domain-containing sensor histidine kinase [Haloarcula sp. CBA1130]|uniref:sensor histidine kinase n=1 Tax=unclassified Haloarcula TaxID=2624677 RepID=UPI001243E7D9|nr:MULTISPECIES: PAS domain-containing sensor histidine kinase [unclassified Haloarcula]KAA9400065.1 PAS domain-containing sensor histidine kinase [Haloarcula sp. CBA1129]KAA9404089.1 PAS domain-containing sensor histidine kinase [Haloarcula sp. CBA1130]